MTEIENKSYYLCIKRFLDIIFAIMIFIILIPLFIIIVILIRLDSKGSAIFYQKRVGRHGKLFTIYKFRTMRIDAPNVSTDELQKMKIDPVTHIGKILRASSFDELPQLVNIIIGDMSFIGPRPALPSQHEVNTMRESKHVQNIRPGITGLAQVMGRDDLADDVKVEYDSKYYQNICFLFDIKILLLTIKAIISSKGNK